MERIAGCALDRLSSSPETSDSRIIRYAGEVKESSLEISFVDWIILCVCFESIIT